MAGINISTLVREAELQVKAAEKHLERVKSMEQDIDKLAREGASLRGSAQVGLKSKLGKESGKKTGKKVGKKVGQQAGSKGRRGAPRGKRTGPTISEQIFNVVAEGSNMASGDVIREMQARREGTKPPSIYTTLNKLKKEGKLGQDGGKWHTRGGGFGGGLV